MSDVLTGTPELDQMQFDLDVAAMAVETATAALRKAIDTLERRVRDELVEAESSAADLDREVAGITDAIEKVAVARGSAKVAAYHPPSVKLQGDAIVAAIKQIAGWERGLLKLQTEAQAAEAGLQKAMDAQWKLVFAFHKHITDALKPARELASIGPSMAAAMESARTQAQQRAERHDANGLSLYQDDARKLDLKRMKALLDDLAGPHDQALELLGKIGSAPREGRKADLDELKRERAVAEKRLAELSTMQKQILALKAEPIDIAKALKVLGLPPQHKGALAQALAKPPAQREKALDDLARDAKVAMKGKAWLQALEKAKVV
ncbi:MAG: hypothetical protein JNN18_20295 [Rubrivivax sp.]|nr:hypothetical protein [Rubrivivax sp.]